MISLSAISGSWPSQSAPEASEVSCWAGVMAPPLAWLMQSATAFWTALLVTVAPVTPSIWLVWAVMICSISLSFAAWPMLSVSPETSSTTSVMRVSSKVTVAVTSPFIPFAAAV